MNSMISITRNVVRQQLRSRVCMVPQMYQMRKMNHGMRFYLTENETKLELELAKEKEKESTETSLEDQLASKDKEIAELKDRYIRSVADFRNLQETTKREIQKAKDFALQKFARDLIESIDNFGHALNAVDAKSIETNKEIKNLYDGVEMTRNIFIKTLKRYGLEEINPTNEKFDPNKHEAVFEIAQPDLEPGTVFHVQQPGYELNGRVLRAAKVGVVKGDD